MNANNNVLADKQGNVFQYDNKGDLKQRENKSWVPSNSSNKSQLDRDVQNRRRGQSLDNSFNQTNRGGNLGGKDNSVQSKSKKK